VLGELPQPASAAIEGIARIVRRSSWLPPCDRFLATSLRLTHPGRTAVLSATTIGQAAPLDRGRRRLGE
jgi:hypothetical protein